MQNKILNMNNYDETPTIIDRENATNSEIISIDTRTTDDEINKFPKYGWLFPCLICRRPTNKETTFISVKAFSFTYNKQTIKKNTRYIAAMCAYCTKRLKWSN